MQLARVAWKNARSRYSFCFECVRGRAQISQREKCVQHRSIVRYSCPQTSRQHPLIRTFLRSIDLPIAPLSHFYRSS